MLCGVVRLCVISVVVFIYGSSVLYGRVRANRFFAFQCFKLYICLQNGGGFKEQHKHIRSSVVCIPGRVVLL